MNSLKTAIPLTLPVMAAYLFLGITYGLLAHSVGLSLWYPLAMAMLVYSGSAEFLAIGMLVVYCLKDTEWSTPPHGIHQAAGIAVTVLLHVWRRNMFLSIAGGTAFFMILTRLSIDRHGTKKQAKSNRHRRRTVHGGCFVFIL